MLTSSDGIFSLSFVVVTQKHHRQLLKPASYPHPDRSRNDSCCQPLWKKGCRYWQGSCHEIASGSRTSVESCSNHRISGDFVLSKQTEVSWFVTTCFDEANRIYGNTASYLLNCSGATQIAHRVPLTCIPCAHLIGQSELATQRREWNTTS